MGCLRRSHPSWTLAGFLTGTINVCLPPGRCFCCQLSFKLFFFPVRSLALCIQKKKMKCFNFITPKRPTVLQVSSKNNKEWKNDDYSSRRERAVVVSSFGLVALFRIVLSTHQQFVVCLETRWRRETTDDSDEMRDLVDKRKKHLKNYVILSLLPSISPFSPLSKCHTTEPLSCVSIESTTRTFSDCQLAGAFGIEIRLCRVFIWMRRGHTSARRPRQTLLIHIPLSRSSCLLFILILWQAPMSLARDRQRTAVRRVESVVTRF